MYLLSRRLLSLLHVNQCHGLRAVLVLLCVLVGGQVTFGQTADPTYGLPTQLSGSSVVSFLASDPHGEASYTLYGHAGLRVQDPEQGIDVTFNYGLFDFSGDFTWRFIQGKTDYIVAPMATADYFEEYLKHGAVHESILKTDSLQRADLWRKLLENIQPAHQVYRYNAFRNNCSTRPLDLYLATLLAAQGGSAGSDTLVLVGQSKAMDSVLMPKTWREVINRLEASSPWLVLGTDLAMGTQLDAPLSLRDRFFIPTDATVLLSHLHYGLRGEHQDQWINLVERTEVYGQSQPIKDKSLWITHPLTLFGLLALLSAFVAYARWRGKHLPLLLESIVFVGAGLAGALLFFLVFISEHPMITTNWNLLVLHPGYLLLPLLALFGRRTIALRRALHYLYIVALVLFPIMALTQGQGINPSVYLIALSLLLLQIGQIKQTGKDHTLHHAP